MLIRVSKEASVYESHARFVGNQYYGLVPDLNKSLSNKHTF